MRLDDQRESSNYEVGNTSGGGGGGFGGFPLGMLLGGGRLGIGGLILVALLYFGFQFLTGGGGGGQQVATGPQAQGQLTPIEHWSLKVLGSTEDTWGRVFQQQGKQYQPTTLHFYVRSDQSGCGAAQSAMGPFYCPTDGKVYLDTAFFDELTQKFGSPGDFAQAYVIAHEVGHHVQDLLGTLPKVSAQQHQVGATEGNALQVKIELQADCYAGVWAANNRDRIEPGDVEGGLKAAHAIGDDTLQQEAQGRVVPDSFTHGTSAQRMEWLKKGIDSGDPAACDTFAAGADA